MGPRPQFFLLRVAPHTPAPANFLRHLSIMVSLRSRSVAFPALLVAVAALLSIAGVSFIAPVSRARQQEPGSAVMAGGAAALLAAAPMPAYAGGMFDFGLTLPFVAVIFLLMMVVLNALWFAPVTAEVDERNAKLLQTLSEATDMLSKADEIQVKYTADIKEAREKASKALTEARASQDKVLKAEFAAATTKRQSEAAQVRQKLEEETAAKMKAAEPEIEKRKSEFVKDTLAEVYM
eukprot:TRINITY_DN2738_c0_g1_i1.p1 TRINITY_DN2738_c0_g1~~TRINITY_DN2738_c0_g1_i1.p1  ORF type:complete len:236 (+),score=56.02 TRINITY_DN2738_c0_g1_i1:1-708(+)